MPVLAGRFVHFHKYDAVADIDPECFRLGTQRSELWHTIFLARLSCRICLSKTFSGNGNQPIK